MPKIAPSILSADFSCLARQIDWIDKAGVEYLHIDVMDGHFVPNISFGIPVVKSLRKHTKAVFDVHLMISEPMKYIERFVESGADLITVHLEAVNSNPGAVLEKIKKLNIKAGMSVKPATPAEGIYPYLPILDLALVMSVEPGFGGQKFMADMLPKVEKISKKIKSEKLNCILQVDGGIDEINIAMVVKSGAELLVCGNSVFGKKDPKQAYLSLMKIANS